MRVFALINFNQEIFFWQFTKFFLILKWEIRKSGWSRILRDDFFSYLSKKKFSSVKDEGSSLKVWLIGEISNRNLIFILFFFPDFIFFLESVRISKFSGLTSFSVLFSLTKFRRLLLKSKQYLNKLFSYSKNFVDPFNPNDK